MKIKRTKKAELEKAKKEINAKELENVTGGVTIIDPILDPLLGKVGGFAVSGRSPS